MVDANQVVWFVLCPLNFLAVQADSGGGFMGGRQDWT